MRNPLYEDMPICTCGPEVDENCPVPAWLEENNLECLITMMTTYLNVPAVQMSRMEAVL